MVPALPPRRTIKYDDATRKRVHDGLTSVIAGHPQALTTYQFYEELDQWLGPWGAEGYPTGYGKFYNVAFSTNARLMADAAARKWVWNTTVFLQNAIRDYIDQRMKDKTLRELTEPELRDAAFASHPKAYTDAGLGMLAKVAPELIPVIADIPAKEFVPGSGSFFATIGQVFRTGAMVTLFESSNVLASMALVHQTNSIVTMAMRRDEQNVYYERQLGIALNVLRSEIVAGKLDDLRILRMIEASLNARSFQNTSLTALARDAVSASRTRQAALRKIYRDLLVASPLVEKTFKERYGRMLEE